MSAQDAVDRALAGMIASAEAGVFDDTISPSDFEAVLDRAVAAQVVPGVVLLAQSLGDDATAPAYERVVGCASLQPGAEVPLRRDTVLALYSLTKLVTAVLVLQALERGQLGLDDDVVPTLPELVAQGVLDADPEDPDEKETVSKITLRQLLTHAAGAGYDFLSPPLDRWARAHGLVDIPPDAPIEQRFAMPLLFAPGSRWAYGTGCDWAGRYLERVLGRDLEDLVVADILAPLGLPAGALTFYPYRYPDVVARLWTSLPARTRETSETRKTEESEKSDKNAGRGLPSLNHRDNPFASADNALRIPLGGSGLFGDAPSYLRLLSSLLRNDGRLLRPDGPALPLLFSPQLPSDGARTALLQTMSNPHWVSGVLPNTGEYDWSLGGLLVTGRSHPRRGLHTLTWSGAMNLTWIIDRESELCAVFASNFSPPGDAFGRVLMYAWEEFIYDRLAKKRGDKKD